MAIQVSCSSTLHPSSETEFLTSPAVRLVLSKPREPPVSALRAWGQGSVAVYVGAGGSEPPAQALMLT